jgi:quinolinate synthase
MMKVDQMLSTEGIFKRPAVSKAPEFVVATEVGILHRLKKEYPDRTFIPASADAICGYMKKITLEKVLWSLQDLKYEVSVPPKIAAKAKKAIDRMVAIA